MAHGPRLGHPWILLQFCWNTATQIVRGCSHPTVAEQSGVVATKTVWPAESKICTLWPFTEKVC